MFGGGGWSLFEINKTSYQNLAEGLLLLHFFGLCAFLQYELDLYEPYFDIF